MKQWKGFVVKPLTVGQSANATEEERTKALVRYRLLYCLKSMFDSL